jgi:hypothetical protein
MAQDLTTPWKALKLTVENTHKGTTESSGKLTDWMTEYLGNNAAVEDSFYLSYPLGTMT